MKALNLIAKIFGKKPAPNLSELREYLKGQVEGKEAAHLEQAMASDPFFAEAMEGLEQHPEALAKFEAEKPSMHRGFSRRKGGMNPLYFIGSALVLSIALTILLNQYTKPLPSAETFPVIPLSDAEKHEPLVSLSETEIEEAVLMEETRQIKTEEVIQSPIKLKAEPSIKQPEFESLVRIEIKTHHAIPSHKTELPQRKNIVFHNAPTVYLHDLLVVDYSKIYKESIPVNSVSLSGTPAYQSNPEDANEAPVSGLNTVYIPYKEYLKSAMEKFSKNKFKAALKDYQVILTHYPEDINALFYGGLCYYNINRPDKAIINFDYVMTHHHNTFIEEAKWYKAQSLVELEQREAAKLLLHQIIEEDGFYSKQAKALYKKI